MTLSATMEVFSSFGEMFGLENDHITLDVIRSRLASPKQSVLFIAQLNDSNFSHCQAKKRCRKGMARLCDKCEQHLMLSFVTAMANHALKRCPRPTMDFHFGETIKERAAPRDPQLLILAQDVGEVTEKRKFEADSLEEFAAPVRTRSRGFKSKQAAADEIDAAERSGPGRKGRARIQ